MRFVTAALKTVLLALAAGVALSGTAVAEPGKPRLAMGLIVKLKDGAAQPSVVRLQAASVSTDSGERVRARLAAAAQRQRVGYLVHRPTAFAAQVIHAGHPVHLADAEAEAARLRADPDVAWVVVNELVPPASVLGQAVVPDDPDYSYQTWLQPRAAYPGVANIPGAWQRLAGRNLTPVVVAVLDSGILPAPDLSGRVLAGYDFVSDPEYARDGGGADADPTDPGDWLSAQDKAANPVLYPALCDAHDSSWHGLAVASMLAAATGNAQDGGGILASLPGAVLLPVRVAGVCGASVSDMIEGMLWAAGISYNGSPARNLHPARVINLSFGGDASCSDTQAGTSAWLYRQTVAALANKGALVVASAGNGDVNRIGLAAPTRPANCEGVLAVTGLNQAGHKARYANLVDGRAHKGVAVASGDIDWINGAWQLVDDGILTQVNAGTTEANGVYPMVNNRFGTSFAAPTAAGVAALMLAADPSLSVPELLAALSTQVSAFPDAAAVGRQACNPGSSSEPAQCLPVCAAADVGARGSCVCTSETCGSGILDADAAVAWAVARADANPGAQPFAGSEASADYFAPERVVSKAPSSGGGGGGALDTLAVLALGVALALVAWLRFKDGRR